MKINQPTTNNEIVMKDGAILASRTDLKGTLIYANEAFIKISGFKEQELVGENHNSVRHPDMPPEAFEDLWSTVKKGEPWTGSIKNRCKNGDYYWVKATVTPVIEKGETTGYMSVRTRPTRQQITQAEKLYSDIRRGEASLKKGAIARLVYMFNSIPIFWRLTGSFSLLMLLTIGLLIGGGLKEASHLVLQSEERELTSVHENVMSAIKSESRLATALSHMVASMPEAQQAFANDDRKRLLELFRASFLKLKSDYGVRQFQFHKPPAFSFLRIHKPAKFGDDLAGFRKTVVSTNTNIQKVTGMEVGVAGLGIRGVVPVFQGGKHLGSVEFGMSFGQSFFDNFKAKNQVDVALLLNRINGLEVFASTFPQPVEINAKQQSRLLSGEAIISQLELDGPVAIHMQAVQDFSGNTIGVLQLGMGRSNYIVQLDALRNNSLMVAGIALLINMIVVYLLARALANPVRKSVSIVQNIADGKYDNDIIIDRNDETGALLTAMTTMQAKLGYNMHEAIEAATESLRIKTALENVSTSVTVSDTDNILIFMNKAAHKQFEKLSKANDPARDFNSDNLIGTSLADFFPDDRLREMDQQELKETQVSRLTAWQRTFEIITAPIINEEGEYEGRITQWNDITGELLVEKEIEDIVTAARSGDLTKHIDLNGKDGFFLQIGSGINNLIDGVSDVFADIANAMQLLAKGDLSQPIKRDYYGTFGEVSNNVNETISNLKNIVARLSESAKTVTANADEIVNGSNNLSSRTEQQAASLEQTAASMEELTSIVKNNAENAQRADKLSAMARETAETGGGVVGRAIEAMNEINHSSTKIAEIIGVIDEIAFQTNLLALNASVEAARAGEQGRGFAVVATEVRNLAGRSATAAKEIKELISDSVKKVTNGSELVNESGETLKKIITGVEETGKIIAEIASASGEQADGIEQVNHAVNSMDEGTQQNAALAEQTTASAVSMSDSAQKMNGLILFFKVS